MRYPKLSERPEFFQLNPADHQLKKGLVFAGLGFTHKSTRYHDSSQRGNHGTLIGASWQYIAELNRWANTFTAEGHYIAAGSVNATTALSVFCWVRRLDTSENDGIVCKYRGAGANNRSWGLKTTTGSALQALLSSDGNTQNANNVTASSAITYNVWVHLGMTYAAGVGTNLYYNGVVVGNNATCPASLFASTQDTWLGAYYDVTGYRLPGIIADAVIHNRVLSLSEIQQLADPSNVMLSGLILPPRRRLFAVSGGAPAAFKPYWARNRNILIGGGVG